MLLAASGRTLSGEQGIHSIKKQHSSSQPRVIAVSPLQCRKGCCMAHRAGHLVIQIFWRRQPEFDSHHGRSFQPTLFAVSTTTHRNLSHHEGIMPFFDIVNWKHTRGHLVISVFSTVLEWRHFFYDWTRMDSRAYIEHKHSHSTHNLVRGCCKALRAGHQRLATAVTRFFCWTAALVRVPPWSFVRLLQVTLFVVSALATTTACAVMASWRSSTS